MAPPLHTPLRQSSWKFCDKFTDCLEIRIFSSPATKVSHVIAHFGQTEEIGIEIVGNYNVMAYYIYMIEATAFLGKVLPWKKLFHSANCL